jgi:uncharacterized protein YkwD
VRSLLAGLLALVLAGSAWASAPVQRARVVEQVNVARHHAGAPPVRVSKALHRAAVLKGRLIGAGPLTHHPRGLPLRYVFDRVGYTSRPPWRGGEVLGKGQRSAAEVVHAWLESPPHRAVLLDPGLEEIGVAWRVRHRVWVAVFGTR